MVNSKEKFGAMIKKYSQFENRLRRTGNLVRLLPRSLAAGLFTLILVLFLFTSCAKKINFLTSSVVPAARGSVKINRDNNKNYNIHIELLNLAEPTRLQPSKKTYVVWMVTDQNETKNIGQLSSSSGFFSNQIKASFETVSATKPSKIFISAEDDGSVQNPGTQVVLSTDNF